MPLINLVWLRRKLSLSGGRSIPALDGYVLLIERAMRLKKYIGLIVLLGSVSLTPGVSADTYSTFQTTRYYSADRRYLVVVTEKKRATLYRNGRRLRRLWARVLQELPGQLFVTNDGKRVAIVDRYYGNGGSPETPVVVILGGDGGQIASHRLGDLADLKRVMQTISAAHWYREARLAPDGGTLIIETHATKREWDECLKTSPSAESEKCWETVPYQQLRFSLSSGALIERVSHASR